MLLEVKYCLVTTRGDDEFLSEGVCFEASNRLGMVAPYKGNNHTRVGN